ncbi:hypothetical protein BLL52_2663 [Rhodoferax antarcticus ANT.BR]|uniref:Uncharacterized protein n=1 Tax=Rhodoferax antarcticus ANT.BR TaxID=1111071 RepID=A0A1Q8YEJ5_9BURK|nr:hypothetical protein BLL52_2663 [Rhodoferax antarcticus ANT.BR]
MGSVDEVGGSQSLTTLPLFCSTRVKAAIGNMAMHLAGQ